MTDQMDVHAVNQDFKRFDQVHKDQVYHLAESDDGEAFDLDYQIKTCDLDLFFNGGDAGKVTFANQLGEALSEIGFAIVVGHGIDPSYYAKAKAGVMRLFEETTRVQRMAFKCSRQGSVNQGYFPIKATSNIHPDLVEGWVFCRRAFDFDGHLGEKVRNFWPLPQLEPLFRDYVIQHEKLFLPLMQSMLRYLGCDPFQYDQKLTATNFGLRLNYYPPISPEQDQSGAGRILGHEDVDMFTLLAAPDMEGLQVLNRKTNRWIRLHAPPGSIIINTGDYMQRISNDIFPSTTHRVSKPRDKSLYERPRISFPIAAYVWEEEMLEVLPELPNPKYPPIKAIAFHTQCTSKFYGDDYAVDDT